MKARRQTYGIHFAMIILISILGSGSNAFALQKHSTKPAGKSIENVATVYRNEIAGKSKYLAFAEKAQAEGYLRVAKLFRAAAQAEGMYVENHAQTLKALKVQIPTADPVFQTGTTEENLKATIAEEKNEVETQYTEFLRQAEAEGNGRVKSVFSGAKAVGANRLLLYQQALKELSAWKADGDIFICQVCGNITAKLDFEYCPICEVPVSRYNKIK